MFKFIESHIVIEFALFSPSLFNDTELIKWKTFYPEMQEKHMFMNFLFHFRECLFDRGLKWVVNIE